MQLCWAASAVEHVTSPCWWLHCVLFCRLLIMTVIRLVKWLHRS